MDPREADESLDELMNWVLDWGGIAAHEAERIVQAEWQRQNPSDPLTDILRARDMLLRQKWYR